MIPKKIHYVWLGRGEKSDLTKKCIESWKKYLADYEIIEWNEDNFDINSNQYLKEAYDNKKYAFASDYIRLAVLYKYGGIYMDTDVEVIKNLDCFLNNRGFVGFENDSAILTAVIGSEAKNEWLKSLLDEYNNISFVDKYGNFDLTTNVVRTTNNMVKNHDLQLNNKYQNLGNITVYPIDYFSPKNWNTGELVITDNTYAIHYFDGSWYSEVEKKQIVKKKKLIEKYGNDIGIRKYEIFLKIAKVKRIVCLPFRALIHPKLVVNKIKGKSNG